MPHFCFFKKGPLIVLQSCIYLIFTFKALVTTKLTSVLCFTLKILFSCWKSWIFGWCYCCLINNTIHHNFLFSHFQPVVHFFLWGICGIHYKGCNISHYTSRHHYKWQGPCIMDCFILTLFLFWCRVSTVSTLHVSAVVVWLCHSFIFVNYFMSSVSKYDLRFLNHPLITLISPAAPPSTSLLSTTHLPYHKKTNLSLDYCISCWGRYFLIWFLGLFGACLWACMM